MNEISPVTTQRIPLTEIIHRGIQKTYHDLTILAELLPQKSDFERKVEIVNFTERTRQLFIRLLALVKWAGTASKIEQCMDIVNFLDKQALLFTNTADNMLNIARTTLVQARLPSFQLPCAVEVLTLGTYSRMPTCIRDRIVPPDPVTIEEKKSVFARLNHIIEQRLSTTNIHPAMRNLEIELGRVTFHVDNEFDLKLTVLGDNLNLPWVVLGIDLLVEDADTGDGKDLVHPTHIKMIERIVQEKMKESPNPLVDVYAKLHNFCLSLQIEVLHDQIDRLMRERLASYIKIKEHIPGQQLAITYWGEKYSLRIETDQTDPSKPLKLTHQPELVVPKKTPTINNSNTSSVITNNNSTNNNNHETEQVLDERDTIFKPGNVSIEQLITDTIQKRSFIKLGQLASELQEKQYGKCTISGAPCLLHVCCLHPCAPSEELIISTDLNGSYLAHVPQYEKSCPLADNIQESLNSNKSKLGTYFDQLKIWLTKKRCIRTIDYLSVTASESLPLCPKANHARLDDKVPRLFFQFNKYNHYYLMAEFSISESDPYNLETNYSLLVTEPAPNSGGDHGLDFIETDSSDLVVVENILKLDVSAIMGANYQYDSSLQEKTMSHFTGTSVIAAKKESLKNRFAIGKLNPSDTLGICNIGSRPPVSLVNELPQLVSFCEEKFAHLALEKELRNRNISYEVSHTETSGHAYCLSFNHVPAFKSNGYTNALRKDTAVMTICLHEKPQSSKIWHCSYIFKDCPITSQSSKEQGPRRLVFTPYESPLSNQAMVSKFIEDTQLDWACMAHLYDVVKDFSRDIRSDPRILNSIVIKSFNYKKLVILYGEKFNFSVSIMWKPTDRKFQLIFSVTGGEPFSFNPHSCVTTHLKHEFNQHRSIRKLLNHLDITMKPLMILQQLPTYPFLGLVSGRPTFPAASFCLLPMSSRHYILSYRNWHSIDILIQLDRTIIVRDGAYSRFDRNKLIEDQNAIHNFEVLLYKSHEASCYLLKMSEFEKIFQVSNLEQHLGMSFMIKNIHKKLSTQQWSSSTRPPSSLHDATVITYASEHMQYRFSLEPSRGLVQLKAAPTIMEEWRAEDIEVLERYFETRIGCYPFKADPFLGFCRILFNFPKSVLKDFIGIFRMELVSIGPSEMRDCERSIRNVSITAGA